MVWGFELENLGFEVKILGFHTLNLGFQHEFWGLGAKKGFGRLKTHATSAEGSVLWIGACDFWARFGVSGLEVWGLKFKIWGFNHEIWGLCAKNWGLDTKSARHACQVFTIHRLNTPLGQQA